MRPLFYFVIFLSLSGCSNSNQISRSIIPVTVPDSVWTSSNMAAFEMEIETLRKQYHIPGLSVGIVNAKKLAWKKGFGYADIENKIVPDENTVYQIASVSKTFGSILLMQQVEAGNLSLDDPIRNFGIDLGARWGSDERIKIKHLLTHTAMGNTLNGFKPGYVFRYNGNWYGKLSAAIEKSSGHAYGDLLMNIIIRPLGLKSTVPSVDDSVNFKLSGYNKDSFLVKVARPYDWKHDRFNPVTYQYSFGPAAGIMSTVSDLSLYSIAIDEKKFLKPATWEQVFTPFKTPKGKTIQYGLGWYVRYYNRMKIMWHTGWWMGYSALFVKVPEKDLTFIVLANSQDLTRPFYHLIQPIPGVGVHKPFAKNLNNNLLASDFAAAFFRYFVDQTSPANLGR